MQAAAPTATALAAAATAFTCPARRRGGFSQPAF